MKNLDLKPMGKKEKKEKITTVRANMTTTGVPKVTLRLTEAERSELTNWVSELEDEVGKKMSPAKIFRGLMKMRKSINTKKLINAINEAT
ncbi:hypothetical protein P3547_19755 [Vibrio parahaemolyticus]|nr:hypothetical protein [Vibrio parahaemolyticus]